MENREDFARQHTAQLNKINISPYEITDREWKWLQSITLPLQVSVSCFIHALQSLAHSLQQWLVKSNYKHAGLKQSHYNLKLSIMCWWQQLFFLVCSHCHPVIILMCHFLPFLNIYLLLLSFPFQYMYLCNCSVPWRKCFWMKYTTQ